MIGVVSVKYALRSLLRHTRRTILSVIGVGIGCGMALLAKSWIGGAAEMQIRAISESGGGHLRVVPEQWPITRENSLRLVDWETALEKVKSLPNLRVAAMRARANGLLAFGNRTAGVQVVGVDPVAERRANRLVSKADIEGRYLEQEDLGNVVIGRTLADQLDVEREDDLFVTLVGREEIQSAMLRIVGIIETGSREVDAMICHVTLRDIEEITGYVGPGEITILLDDYRLIESRHRELAGQLPAGDVVITWKEVNAALAAGVESDRGFTRVLVGIIVVVVSLGIASAQLTAVLERRTEFAVLSALGMKGRQVISLVVLEALAVGLGGAFVALALGGTGAYYLSTRGVNLAALVGEEFSFSIGEVLLEPYVFGDFGIWLVWYALGVSVTSTMVASIYPAWLATRLNPADALRTG